MSIPLDRARQLRKDLTDTERLVWSKLRNRRFAQFKFRRQVPLGNFIVDFVCFDRRLIVELDGGQHTLQREYDEKRTGWLKSQGFDIVRFWNHEVFQDWDAIEELIWRKLQQNPSPPTPLPQGERGEERR
jgi:very-short-patch-repair endonuclease